MSDGQKKKKLKGGQVCSVAVCKNYYSKTKGAKISYFVFPKDPLIRKIWIANCRRGGVWKLDNARVCSEHFAEDQFEDDVEARIMNIKRPRRLKESAIPTLKLESPMPVKRRIAQTWGNEDVRGNKSRRGPLVKQEPETSTSEAVNYDPPVDKSVQTEQDQEIISANQILEVNVLESDSCINCKNLNIAPVLVENTRLMAELLYAKSQCVAMKQNLEEVKSKLKEVELEKTCAKAAFDKKELSYKTQVEKLAKVEASLKSIFSPSQLDLVSKSKKRINWEVEVIKRSIILRRISKKAFLYVKNVMRIPLPAVSSLQRWLFRRKLRNIQKNLVNGVTSSALNKNSVSGKSKAKITLKSLASLTKKSSAKIPKEESSIYENDEILIDDAAGVLMSETDQVVVHVSSEPLIDVSHQNLVIVSDEPVEEKLCA